ncbi:hypothetical protein Mapa_013164 [Marchantia paleacea]|nr:hypothetical protein Mapa_013164 [Marchantia paleacea]
MAQNALILILITVLLVSFRAAIAEEYIVGGENGWVLPIQANDIGNNYTTWADSFNFKVGDSLVFKYKKESHSVLQVNGTAFADCITSDPLGAWKDGNTSIVLKEAGRMWFICGAPGHCEQGQKFKVTVLACALPVLDGQTEIPPASAPQPGAGNGIYRSAKSATIIGSIVAGAFYLL